MAPPWTASAVEVRGGGSARAAGVARAYRGVHCRGSAVEGARWHLQRTHSPRSEGLFGGPQMRLDMRLTGTAEGRAMAVSRPIWRLAARRDEPVRGAPAGAGLS